MCDMMLPVSATCDILFSLFSERLSLDRLALFMSQLFMSPTLCYF
jgi:hypothetical protein